MPLCTRKTLLEVCLAAGLLLTVVAYANDGDESSTSKPPHEEQSGTTADTPPPIEVGAETASDVTPSSNILYKSVDAKGNITYADKPSANNTSEALKMPSINSMPMAPPVIPVKRRDGEGEGDKETGPVEYTRFEIVSPTNDSVLGQDIDMVSINAVLEPGLQEGHTVQLFYNGKPVGNPGDLSFSIEGLERGTYTVEAKILDNKKQVLKSTAKVRFSVYRHSILDGKGKLKDPNNKVPQPTPPGSISGFNTGKGLDTGGTGVGGGDKGAKTPEEKKPPRGVPGPNGAKSSRGF